MKGTVIRSTGSWYYVKTESGSVRECRMKGAIRLEGSRATNPVAVGDYVELEEADEEGKSVIKTILERKNHMIRRSVNLSRQTHVIAANMDRIYVINTIVSPRTAPGFIDRILISAETFGIPATILINKKDLYTPQEIQAAEERAGLYHAIGYDVKLISAFDASDILLLRKELYNNISLFTGHSGSGKSTLINAIQPGLRIKTGVLSDTHDKGMHTTTFAEMHFLEKGGAIIDTPGIKEFGITGVEKNELSHFFPEIFRASSACRFNGCMHMQEPGCAVRAEVEKGEIGESRYMTYLNILEGDELVRKFKD
ncbi:MAG: ribosome small subunit-dependent GTPase A [Bacteroidia bacterium]|nr:ribosome small subunit-dependent GTPase A [Bacteroidia bacterium]